MESDGKVGQRDDGEAGRDREIERLRFLARLPLQLNSSLDIHTIVGAALGELCRQLDAEAATVFLLNEPGGELMFWALRGGGVAELSGKRMPADKGIVGWAIEQRESVIVDDVRNDPRFFATVDSESDFVTRNIICVPMLVRSSTVLGAVQILNRRTGVFSAPDLEFLEQCAHQLALAIDNARLFSAVRDRNEKLSALDRRKSEMTSVLVHEFRTPLNVIQNAAMLLVDSAASHDRAAVSMAETLERSVGRLSRLVGQLKNVSVLTEEQVKIERQAVPVTELLRRAAQPLREAAVRRKLSLQERCPADVSAVLGDPVLLTVVLTNLLANAIRFTPDGGEITLAAEEDTGMVTLRVMDTGIGIPAEEIPLVFERFYEVGSALNHSSGEFEFRSGGLGLGLAAVRAILEAHGATVRIESIAGRGTTVLFSLPALPRQT